MSEHNGYSGAHLLLAFLAGAATGACAALLTAPGSGTETRETVRGWARDARGQAVRVPEVLRGAYRRASTAAKAAFNEALQDRPRPAETDTPAEG